MHFHSDYFYIESSLSINPEQRDILSNTMNNRYSALKKIEQAKICCDHFLANSSISSNDSSEDTNSTAVKTPKSFKTFCIDVDSQDSQKQTLLKNLLMESIQEQNIIRPDKTKCLKLNFDSDIQSQSQEAHTSKCAAIPTEPLQTRPLNYRDYHRIEDLDEVSSNWQLLARVIDVTYRQFTSKQGKSIQLLTVEFIDANRYIIPGCCFGGLAQQLKAVIKKGKLYKISHAKIQANAYSKQSFKYSKYQMKFHSKSILTQTEDTPDIPKDSHIELFRIVDNNLQNHQLNFIGILLQIKPVSSIPKDGRQLKLQKMKIGDPNSGYIFDVTIWNKIVEVDMEMLNKTVVLKHFRVDQYKNQNILVSTYRSGIQRHSRFKQYEGTWLPLDQETWIMSPEKTMADEKAIKTIKELSYELSNADKQQTIYSYLNVWLVDLCFEQKWFYQACPNSKCKKSAKPNTICQHCSTRIRECKKMFSLKVILGDLTGSISVMAFNQAVDEFFEGISLNYLAGLPQGQLIMRGQMCRYENYVVNISSKKDPKNNCFFHTILGVPERVEPKTQIVENFKQVDKLRAELVSMQE